MTSRNYQTATRLLIGVCFAVGSAGVSLRGQTNVRHVQQFDGTGELSLDLPVGLPALPALPFSIGEVDLSTLGVSDADLSTVGPSLSPTNTSPTDNMLIVDDDGLDCPNFNFVSIQSAVLAAAPNSKIKVCRGTYNEQVEIPAGKDGLVIFAEAAFQAIIKAPPIMTSPKAIVRINGAHDVTIRHFTITGPGGGPCDSIEYGVRIDGGGSGLITDNHITEIHDTPFSGCQNGVGVLVGRNFQMQTGFGTIVHNTIDRYQKGGVVVDGQVSPGARSHAEVAFNEITGVGVTPIIAQNGIQVSRSATADVHHNKVSLNNYGLPFTDSEGILLFDENPGTTVHHNYVFLNDDGIGLFTTTGAQVDHNRSTQNDLDGVVADTDAVNNEISYNLSRDNTEFDCADYSAGPYNPPAFVANPWIKDLGNTENRPGLCKAAPQ